MPFIGLLACAFRDRDRGDPNGELVAFDGEPTRNEDPPLPLARGELGNPFFPPPPPPLPPFADMLTARIGEPVAPAGELPPLPPLPSLYWYWLHTGGSPPAIVKPMSLTAVPAKYLC